ADIGEDPGLLDDHGNALAIDAGSLQLAREHHAQGVEDAPDRECPGRAVPDARDQERDEQIAIGEERAAAASAERDVNVIAEPGGEADVPARPEFAQPGG